jgi:hypothetical protein
VRLLLELHCQVRSCLVGSLVPLTREDELGLRAGARAHSDFFLDDDHLQLLAVALQLHFLETDSLPAAVEEFLESAGARNRQVLKSLHEGVHHRVSLRESSHLLHVVVQLHSEGVLGPKELLEDFVGVAHELVAPFEPQLLIRHSCLQKVFAVSVVEFSEFRSGQHFVSLAHI